MRKIILILSFFIVSQAWTQGEVSGDVMLNANFFMRDSSRLAMGTPQYNHQMYGSDGWLALNYVKDDFKAGIRFDMHQNSNLHAPNQSFSGQGVGRWYIQQKIDKLEVTGGYFYDQFANGILFRAFEMRTLGIDNAVFGFRLKYEVNEHLEVKGFTGRQKNRFELFEPVMKGINLAGNYKVGKVYLNPGASAVSRTLDNTSMNSIVASINAQSFETRFEPRYNVYAFSVNNGLSYGRWAWDIELGKKTPEALFIAGDGNGQRYELRDGSIIYNSLTYSKKGLGITGQYKRTENFSFRVSPTETGLRGVINYLPPLTRQNTYRLAARYAAQSLELSEQAMQLDVVFKLNKKWRGVLNTSNVTNLDNELMFREVYFELQHKVNKKLKIKPGIQYLQLDQETYGLKGTGLLTSIVPMFEIQRKLKKRRSIRAEVSLMSTEQDFGSWTWMLVEAKVSKHWTISASDMYNYQALRTDEIHYPTIYTQYTHKQSRYSFAYVKQVEGIVCTGGVCRYEPAFSGVRFTMNTNF
jgi:hypothetical protein